MRRPCSMLLLSASLLCSRLSCSRTLSWWASYSSRLGYILEIRASKFGSARRERLDTSFFLQVGHSLFLQRKIIKGQKWARNIWSIESTKKWQLIWSFLNVKEKLWSYPDRSAVTMHSEQKRCRHSLVVMVFFSMSRQMGHISSLWRLLGDTAISVLSIIASWNNPYMGGT